MTLKKRSERAVTSRPVVSEDEADRLADRLADKGYGDAPRENITSSTKTEEVARTSISLPRSLLQLAEDKAMSNKRSGVEPKSVSAMVKMLFEDYLKNNKY